MNPQQQKKPARFQGLAWASLITGITGVLGSTMIFINNLTALGALVGVILGGIALFGTRKLLAGGGILLCVLAIVLTVQAQKAATEELDRKFNEITREFGK